MAGGVIGCILKILDMNCITVCWPIKQVKLILGTISWSYRTVERSY